MDGTQQYHYSLHSTCGNKHGVTLTPVASFNATTFLSPTINPGQNETTTFVYYANICLVKQGLLINGVGTAVKVSPTSLTFPTTAVGATSTKVVTFQNAGNTTMTITSANLNATMNVFSIQSNTCNFVKGSGGNVPPNSSCTFTLAFSPTVTGTQTGKFTIGDPAITGPQIVTFSGTGQ